MSDQSLEQSPPGETVDLTPEEEEKPSLVKRFLAAYRKASGGSLLLSIAVHAVILLIGAYLVVSQIAEERKISFGGGESGPKSEVRHKVKTKTTTAPAPTKRITTTGIATVALPDMPDIPNNMGPSIAGAMGSGGFGSAGGLGGGGGGGGGGSGSGQGNGFSKITFFGLNGGKESDGLVGTFYDLKQSADGKPTSMQFSALEKANPKTCIVGSDENKEYIENVKKFNKAWSKNFLPRFFKAPQKLVANQIVIPRMTADAAPKAYGVEKECAPKRWIAYYEATIVPPRDGRFRFRGIGDDIMMVRINGQVVLDGSLHDICRKEVDTEPNDQLRGGKWMNMRKGVPMKMELIIGEMPGGVFYGILCLEEEKVAYPAGYPVFQLKAGPIPPCPGFPVGKEAIVFGVQTAKTGYGSLLP